MNADPTFTEDELIVIESAGACMGALRRIAEANIAEGRPPVEGDLAEACAAIHAIQHMGMISSAARANPEAVRPFGAGFVEQPT